MSLRQSVARYQRVLISIIVMAVVTGLSTAVSFTVLYQAAFSSRQIDLIEMVNVKAGLINAVGRFDAQFSQADHPEGSFAATLSQVKDANLQQQGFGKTGEFVIGRSAGNRVLFKLPSRHLGNQIPDPIDIQSTIAIPMLLGLQGKQGAMIARDFRDEEVLAAFLPLEEEGYAIVAKIDMSELRQPFYKAAAISFIVAMGLITFAVIVLHRVNSPLIFRLEALVRARTKELDEANRELLYLSQHDNLTGIGNRSWFLQQLRHARVGEENSVALLMIDLDGFKPINDRYGHPTGDTVLAQIGQRLKLVVRACDGVARIGGDEFAVILRDLEKIDEAVNITEGIIDAIKQPIEVSVSCHVCVGCSVGIAFDQTAEESDAALITRADTAMYDAKRQVGVEFTVG